MGFQSVWDFAAWPRAGSTGAWIGVKVHGPSVAFGAWEFGGEKARAFLGVSKSKRVQGSECSAQASLLSFRKKHYSYVCSGGSWPD